MKVKVKWVRIPAIGVSTFIQPEAYIVSSDGNGVVENIYRLLEI